MLGQLSHVFTDLVFLQGEELVTRGATADQLSSAVKGGETQPAHVEMIS